MKPEAGTSHHERKRYDIQGLRAWAVIAVVIFHFFPRLLPYGYLGVDIFFVLSGYLISLVLEGKPFALSTYTGFYFKRLRRILPLALLITLLCTCTIIYLQEGAELESGIKSAIFSLFYATNLKPQSVEEDYFAALEKANDFFTHFWSLSVEIQFYVVAPTLLHALKPSADKVKSTHLYLCSISFASLLLFIFTEPTKAFSSTPARMWQFLAGALALHMEICLSGRRLILDPEPIKQEAPSKAILTFYIMASSLLVLYFGNEESILRIEVTLFTSFLLVAALETTLLCHKILQIIGDISYSLYLIHWPVVCIMKEFEIDEPVYLFTAMVLSITLSVFCHFCYEKWYLTLSKRDTALLVSALYVACLVVISSHERNADMERQSINITEVLEKNLTLTEAEAAIINLRFEKTNQKSLIFPGCNAAEGRNPFGFCELQRGEGKLHFLLMGNSYMPNFGEMLMEHLRPHYGEIQSRSIPQCEPLILTKKDPYCPHIAEAHATFDADVERVNPDVLILVFRFVKPEAPLTGPVEEDVLYQYMKRRFDHFEKHVKRKVILMQAFPLAARLSELEKKRAKQGLKMLPYMPEAIVSDAEPMRKRVLALAKSCEKCAIFDIAEMFADAEGRFTVLDGRNHLRYFDRARHLTVVGRRLVEPMIAKLGDEFPRLLESEWPDNVLTWNKTR